MKILVKRMTQCMEENLTADMVYITGHKNPDTDSICAAYCYAYLKNTVDPKRRYVPVRCGNMNHQTKSVFKKLDLAPLALMTDVYPKVGDVAKRNIITLNMEEPIFTAIKELDERTISVIPVLEKEKEFRGLVSIHEISEFLIADNLQSRPVYQFNIANFKKVLPGYFYRRGNQGEFSAPIMIGAMPYLMSLERIKKILPRKPVLIVGPRADLIKYAIQEQFPAIILTGIGSDRSIPVDFSSYAGTVYISQTDTAETIRLLRLSEPLKNIMNSAPLSLDVDEGYDTAKKTLLSSDYRGIPVFEKGKFIGIVTRRCFIEKPRKKIILVDHNEISQSIAGADQADIIEIIDHHRLGAASTKEPIYIFARPVGSSCTIVYQHFLIHSVPITKPLAYLLISGILSDTLGLKSPTTTDTDITATRRLANIAKVDVCAFGNELLAYTETLNSTNIAKSILADIKMYNEYGTYFGIGQVEVATFQNIDDVCPQIFSVLEKVRKKYKLGWMMLMVTDIIEENSLLFTTPFTDLEEMVPYTHYGKNIFNLPGILSRKKQLLPEILKGLEGRQQNNYLYEGRYNANTSTH